MENVLVTGFPPTFINQYVVGQLERFGILSGTEQMVPVFPTTPTNIEDVFKNYIAAPGISDPLLIQYERLIRFRPNSFYRNKREQLVYFIYGPDLTKLFDATRVIIECLDREDSAAQDLNSWIATNDIEDESGNAITPNVMFHNIKVYQADEARDIAELASARTLFLNKLVIEYDYHTQSVAGSTQRYT